MSKPRSGRVFPGVVLTFFVAIAAMLVQRLPVPPLTLADGRHPIDAILLAIVIGIVLRNTLQLPEWLKPGIKYSVKSILPLAIVLLGAKLDFYDILRVSGQGLLINLTCVVVALFGTVALCTRMGVGRQLGLLIGIGTAICGGTAIAVTAPVIEASDDDTAFAVTAVNLFGLLAIVVLPTLGALMGLSQEAFGVWAGTAVHATPQVMAAGYAYGPVAGDIAVIVKLVRVLLLAPMVVGLGWWYAREKRRQQQAHVTKKTSLLTLFPPFVFGFLAVALANSFNLLPDFTLHLEDSPLWTAGDRDFEMARVATKASGFLITMAMAGVGLGVSLKGLASVGLKALYVGLFATVVLAGFCLTLITFTL